MTLMTLIYGLILDEGMRRYFVGSLTASTQPDVPDAENKEPRTYAIFEATSGVGFVEPPFITQRRYPTTDYPTHPDDNKPLTYAGYSGYRRVVGLYEKVGERGYPWESRRRIGRWCSGRAQGMV
jgi:hypothetical protein